METLLTSQERLRHFIPLKWSNQGKKFGFVKYKDVHDVDSLVLHLQGVAIGAAYITINEAKCSKKRTTTTQVLEVRLEEALRRLGQ